MEAFLRAMYKAPSRSASCETVQPSEVKRALSRMKDRLSFPGRLAFHSEVASLHPQSGAPIFKLTVTVQELPGVRYEFA